MSNRKVDDKNLRFNETQCDTFEGKFSYKLIIVNM